MQPLSELLPRLDALDRLCACGAPSITGKCDACRDGERQLAEREQRRAESGARVADAFARLALPAMYADARVADFPPAELLACTSPAERSAAAATYDTVQRFALRFLAALADDPKNAPLVVILSGPVGSGKTRLAAAIAREFVLADMGRATFRSLGDIVRDIRETWRREGAVPESVVLNRYRHAGLLVVDDVSRHAFVGEPTSHLFEIVAAREADLRPTIITSNEDKNGLASLLGAPLLSRAAAYRAHLTFPSTDLRLLRGLR